jgi:hypothetical protein
MEKNKERMLELLADQALFGLTEEKHGTRNLKKQIYRIQRRQFI